MWLGWPFLVYEEWLKLMRPPMAPSELASGERFGIAESDRELVLVAEVPEYRSMDLNATIDEHVVQIHGQRREEAEAGELHISFDRKINLPPSVKVEGATTRLQDGLVEVHIPKISEAADLGVKLPDTPAMEDVQEPAASESPAPRAPSLTRRSSPKGPKKRSATPRSATSKRSAKKPKRR